MLQRHFLQQQPHHPLAVSVGGPPIPPHAGKIVDQLGNRLPFKHREAMVFGLLLACRLLLDLGQFPQAGVPLRLQHVRNQAVLWIDPLEAALRELGGVAGAFHMLGTEALCGLNLGMQLVVDRKAGLHCQRCEAGEQQIGNCGIQTVSQHLLTQCRTTRFNGLLLAQILRDRRRTPLELTELGLERLQAIPFVHDDDVIVTYLRQLPDDQRRDPIGRARVAG